ncbi:kelch-like protein 2 [Orbicella faveolata]|uniref:kelch-like protein 2 n=1 Tax=Orbicella faveolata TaxID=48498 RepID=UPI0009E46C04|nr:kelch-like protein 2 [Orbicella faveolata]
MSRSCGITLVVKDGKQFQADRNVLSRASPFFEKLLSSDMKESNEGVIRLQTITDSQMADILQFIYNGSVQMTCKGNAEKLIETADFLLLSNLKTIAGKFLEQHITTETCISMNYLAEQYSCEELVASTRKFINSNFTTVTASKEFLNLPSHAVEKWISSDEIEIDAEENVFEIILRWIDHDKSERSGKFSDLFSHVRLTCVSRDYLLSHVVTNDLVKENADCLDSVTGALEWFDRPTDCDVPRPHPPRKALTINGIVIADCRGELQPCIYFPAADEWYLLPATESQRLNAMEHIFSCGGKVFFIADDIARSHCYDPDLNRWYPAPWTNNLPFSAGTPLVVEDRICFIVEETSSTALWTYSVDSNSLTPLLNWVERAHFCAVAVDSYIYIMGGRVKNTGESVSECARFDTEQNKWQKIAPLNEARHNAFGVCKNENIFIAGGSVMEEGELEYLRTCEVYNILTDEWQFIAEETLRRTFGSMVLVDETLYVLGGHPKELCACLTKNYRDKVECYNPESDQWSVKATVPVNKMTSEKRAMRRYVFQGCSLRVFKGVLTNLESIAESD